MRHRLNKSFRRSPAKGRFFTYFLCLRSTGGDLREAVKIAQFVMSTRIPSIATIMEDGQTCASACAIIFLAGSAADSGGRRASPHRFLHPRGRLLIHSSQLDLGRLSDKDLLAILTKPTTDPRGLRGKIVDLYKDGLRDVQSVIATFQPFIFAREDLGDHWVRPSLFLDMFARDPDEWICVDNVDAVGRWNIQVYGYQPPRQPSKQNFSNACRSAYHWRYDEFAVGADYDLNSPRGVEELGELKRPPASSTLAGRNISNAEFDDRYTMSVQAHLLPLTCVIELHDTRRQLNTQSVLTTFFLTSSTPSTIVVSQLSPTAFYPAATLLRDLPGIRPPSDRDANRTRPAVDFTEYPGNVMNGCFYKSIPKMERQPCQAACAVDPACVAYSHNKVTKACELKHTLTALRLDPLWTSGVPSAGPAPSRSIHAEAMIDYYSQYGVQGDLRGSLRIDGKLIDEAKVDTFEACKDRCKSDPTCLALENWSLDEGFVCRRFSEVTGVSEDPVKEKLIEIDIKKQ
jgi:hypothetical protein